MKMKVVFVDKNFKWGCGLSFSNKQLREMMGFKTNELKDYWERLKKYCVKALKLKLLKNFKSYEEYEKALKKFWKKDIKKYKNLPWKEIRKKIPEFKSSLKEKDIRVVFIGKKEFSRFLLFKECDYKELKKTIKYYLKVILKVKNI